MSENIFLPTVESSHTKIRPMSVEERSVIPTLAIPPPALSAPFSPVAVKLLSSQARESACLVSAPSDSEAGMYVRPVARRPRAAELNVHSLVTRPRTAELNVHSLVTRPRAAELYGRSPVRKRGGEDMYLSPHVSPRGMGEGIFTRLAACPASAQHVRSKTMDSRQMRVLCEEGNNPHLVRSCVERWT
jgi:hypothetical protein